ncbi:MAG: hypothetical protein AAFW69_12475, partial [Pseudomonadota bacterium]
TRRPARTDREANPAAGVMTVRVSDFGALNGVPVPGRTAGRIVSLTRLGRPVAPGDRFLLATNGFRAAGGGRYPGLGAARLVLNDPEIARDIVLRHLVQRGWTDHRPTPAFRFAPLGGTRATFDSGPLSRAYLDQLEHLEVEAAGMTNRGFARYRLTL